MTDTSGRQTLVLSNRPPRPTSTTATSHRRRTKCRNPSAVPISKNVGEGNPVSASIVRTAGATSAMHAASSACVMGTPFT